MYTYIDPAPGASFNASVFYFDQHLEDSDVPTDLVFLRMKNNVHKLHVK